jgi:microfibrillar-associated protein 1
MPDERKLTGAIPVRNKKGERVMQKVKVERYRAGIKPDFASASDVSEDEDAFADVKQPEEIILKEEEILSDRRLKRLIKKKELSRVTDLARVVVQRREISDGFRRKRHEPEVLIVAEAGEELDRTKENEKDLKESSDNNIEVLAEQEDDEKLLLKRKLLKEKLLQQELQELPIEDDKSEAEESSEYEDVTDSEIEDEPMLKPVFVKKSERSTILDKEVEVLNEEAARQKEALLKERRKQQAIALVAKAAKQELEVKSEDEGEENEGDLSDGDGDEQEEYEKWKVRELARLKRDKEEREALLAVQLETQERRKTMTDAELIKDRLTHQNLRPKGTLKYLQKYYHRGAFFVQDTDETIYNRDYTAPTGEDLFDKTILPKVMQVKNFGRSGRTKWTHLTAEDTTNFDSPWLQISANSNKLKSKMGGMKQDFSRPSSKKKKSSLLK